MRTRRVSGSAMAPLWPIAPAWCRALRPRERGDRTRRCLFQRAHRGPRKNPWSMSKNTFKTFVLLAAFGGLLMGIGSLFGTGGLVIGLGIALLFVGGSYWFSDTIAVKAAGAAPVTEQQAPDLYAIVRELAQRDGMPMPRVYLSPASQPNAFATGRGPEKAVVCVTQGLLQVLDRDELRGVLAHELSHVKNRDILIGSVAAALAMGITFIARMAM